MEDAVLQAALAFTHELDVARIAHDVLVKHGTRQQPPALRAPQPGFVRRHVFIDASVGAPLTVAAVDAEIRYAAENRQ